MVFIKHCQVLADFFFDRFAQLVAFLPHLPNSCVKKYFHFYFSLRCSRTGSRNLCLARSYRLSATQAILLMLFNKYIIETRY